MLILITQPLDSRNRNRYALDYWLGVADKLTIIDLTQLLYPVKSQYFSEQGGKLDISGLDYYSPHSILDCISLLFTIAIGHKHYFDYANDGCLIEFIRLMLASMQIRRIKVLNGLLPQNLKRIEKTSCFNSIVSIASKAKKYSLRRFISKIFEKLLRKARIFFEKFDYYVATSDGCLKLIPSFISRKNIIYACSFDYDVYIDSLRTVSFSNNSIIDTAVFLDGDLCSHPDFLTSDSISPVTASLYYPALNKFLKSVEDKLQLNVLIAAHPRSHYTDEKITSTYPDFQVFSHKTAELIRNCKVVFTHDSTAVSFACLYGKPIIFLVTDELINDGRGGYLDGMICYLGGKVINLDDVVEVSRDLLMQDMGYAESYRNYLNEFVKCSIADPSIKSHEIIANHILAIG